MVELVKHGKTYSVFTNHHFSEEYRLGDEDISELVYVLTGFALEQLIDRSLGELTDEQADRFKRIGNEEPMDVTKLVNYSSFTGETDSEEVRALRLKPLTTQSSVLLEPVMRNDYYSDEDAGNELLSLMDYVVDHIPDGWKTSHNGYDLSLRTTTERSILGSEASSIRVTAFRHGGLSSAVVVNATRTVGASGYDSNPNWDDVTGLPTPALGILRFMVDTHRQIVNDDSVERKKLVKAFEEWESKEWRKTAADRKLT